MVEVDGDTHSRAHELAHDAKRTAYLETTGLRVVRVTNHGIYDSLEGACRAILEALEATSPRSPASDRGEDFPYCGRVSAA